MATALAGGETFTLNVYSKDCRNVQYHQLSGIKGKRLQRTLFYSVQKAVCSLFYTVAHLYVGILLCIYCMVELEKVEKFL